MRSAFTLVLLVSTVFAGTLIQTDWSGDEGVLGPVFDWSDALWSSDAGIEFSEGELGLSSYLISPEEHTVDDTYLSSASHVTTSDIDSDGDQDLVVSGHIAGRAFGSITLWKNEDGLGTSWTKLKIQEIMSPEAAYSADIDGDGDEDILGTGLHGSEYGRIFWCENRLGSGLSWTSHLVVMIYGVDSVHPADLDGDGDADVLAATGYAGEILWWENIDGTGANWTEHTVSDELDKAASVCTADFDGDGDTDVLGADDRDDDVIWWENIDGTGTSWIEHVIDGDFNAVNSVYSTDVDGDGDADVVGAGGYNNDGSVVYWENTDGTGLSWTAHRVDGDFTNASSVYSTDMDCDGDADIIASGSGAFSWWENSDTSPGVIWLEHIVDEDFVDWSAYATDIDGDGDGDIVGSGHYPSLAWWDVIESPLEGNIESSILHTYEVREWNSFFAGVEEPSGTSVSFQFRSSNDASNMGTWSDTVFASNTTLEGILEDSTGFLQYKAILKTPQAGISPELTEVAFEYTQVTAIPLWSLQPSENPSHGSFSALVSVSEDVSVELTLYDISGRIVEVVTQELSVGTHSIDFFEISEGVYFCTMTAGEFSATERVVVLK